MSAWKLAIRQGLAYKRPLLAVAATMLVAITVLAATPIYFATITELSLRHALAAQERSSFNLQVVVPVTPLEPAANAKTQHQVDDAIASTVGWLVTEQRAQTESRSLVMSRLGTPPDFRPGADTGYMQSFPDYESHVRLFTGQLPAKGVAYFDGVPQVEALIGPEAASGYDLKSGDIITLNDRLGGRIRQLRVKVAGIGAPNDPDEDYWSGLAGPLFGSLLTMEAPDTQVTQEDPPPLGFVVEHAALLESIHGAFPGQVGSSIAVLYTDLDSITTETVEAAQASMKRLSVELTNSLPRAIILTQLDVSLEQLEERLFFARIPLLALTLLVETAVFYVLIMVSQLLIAAQRESTVLIGSRGASPLQVLTVYGGQAAFLALVGLLLGPPLAAAAVALLGVTPPFASLTGATLLPFRLLPSAYVWGLAAAAAAVALLGFLALWEMRLSPVSHRQQRGRPSGPVLLQRYYLDVFLIAVAGLFLWNVSQNGALVSRAGPGAFSVDQTILLTPVIFLLGLLLLTLRLFPLALRLASWIGQRTLPAWAALGLSQMGRRPFFYSQLLLLVVLVTALGWFGATFGATLERSNQEQALYRTGVDFSISQPASFPLREVDDLEDFFSRVPGVESVSTAFNGTAGLGTSNAQSQLLALDPRSATNLYWFREDFAKADLTELMVQIGAGSLDASAKERELPLDTSKLGVWVKTAQRYPGIFLWAIFRDGQGGYASRSFGDLDFEGWKLLEVSVRAGGVLDMVPPATIEAVVLFQSTFRQGTEGQIMLDDLHAVTTSGGRVTLDGFEDMSDWTAIATSPSRLDTVEALQMGQETKEGQSVAKVTFGRETANGLRGFYHNPLRGPTPILANARFLTQNGLRVGDTFIMNVEDVMMPVTVRNTVRYFPSLDPDFPFVIAPLDPVLDYVNLIKGGAPVRPNQIVLDLPEDPGRREAAIKALEQRRLLAGSAVVDRQEELLKTSLDPLAAVGWRGLVFASFAVLLLIVLVGYVSFSFLAARDRRWEVSVVRALGLERKDVVRWVLLENALVLGVGATVGSWAGLELSRIMVPLMSFTKAGLKIVPPFFIETSWPSLGVLLFGLAAGVALTVLIVGGILARVSASRVLRTGEV